MSKYLAGIDLGGTNIAAGIVDEWGHILGRGHLPVRSGEESNELCKDMKKVLMDAVKRSGISYDQINGIGIGVPGAVYGKERKIGVCNNLRLNGFPMKETMEMLCKKSVTLENDANAAIYGEMKAGAGKSRRNLLMLTLGTGVGSGIIINGEIFSGARGLGGEIGHMGIVYDGERCTCKRRGCFETYASANGLIRICTGKLIEFKDSILWKRVNEGQILNGEMIFEAMKDGDPAAEKAVDEYIKYLSYGIAGCIYIFDPECIIIGGGISNQGVKLADRIRLAVKHEVKFQEGVPDIVCAKLGNDAGIIGAAFLGDI